MGAKRVSVFRVAHCRRAFSLERADFRSERALRVHQRRKLRSAILSRLGEEELAMLLLLLLLLLVAGNNMLEYCGSAE